MNRNRAIEIMVRVWGNSNTITGAEVAEIQEAGMHHGEDVLDALHRISGIAKPDPEKYPSFHQKTVNWYKALAR